MQTHPRKRKLSNKFLFTHQRLEELRAEAAMQEAESAELKTALKRLDADNAGDYINGWQMPKCYAADDPIVPH